MIALALYVLCAVFGRGDSFAFWEKDLRYEGESVYNYLQVKEDERSVVFATNVLFGVQSVMMKDGGLTGMYYDYALAAPVICAKEEPRVLVLGNGTGTYARQCLNYFPSCTVEGVEIDGKITELAGRYFDLPDAVQVTEYDGRAFLQAVDTQYDVILVDAYQDITIPFQMSTVEFFTMVRGHLKPGGVMAVNMNMHSDGEGSINEALCDTIAAVFPSVATVDVARNTNRELFACTQGEIAARLDAGVGKLETGELRTMMRSVAAHLETVEGGGNVLSDDRAPVELLGMRAIDALIADELEWLRETYDRVGLRGLIDYYL